MHPTINISSMLEIITKSLREEAEVKVLSQETVLVCKNLNEITTEDDLREALKQQCNLVEVYMTIRISRSSYYNYNLNDNNNSNNNSNNNRNNNRNNNSSNNRNNNNNTQCGRPTAGNSLPRDKDLLAAARVQFSRPPFENQRGIRIQRGETLNPYPVVHQFNSTSAPDRSGNLQRSPVTPLVATASAGSGLVQSEPRGNQREMGLPNRVFTSRSGSDITHYGPHLGKSYLTEVRKKVDELYEFVRGKHNVHNKEKQLVTSIKSAVTAAKRKQKALLVRNESAEKALMEAAEHATAVTKVTPKNHHNTRWVKSVRDTPGEQEDPKKQKSELEGSDDQRNVGKDRGWRIVGNQQAERRERKQKEEKKKEQGNKEKRKPSRERHKGDALITEAALLKKVKEDPELKELAENVVKTRRTQKSEMIFELKNDPSVKGSIYRELLAKSLGNEANVRALSQEAVVRCKVLDEITTVEELKVHWWSSAN
ncbi:myb-like protein W [Topomyia yanbarensis]|uniref:myb-like protein W n=1 Tax=Topomyia yanbarensis TaxID=2498891 RepID=UPI00273CBF36|nr:myb-like protein W [Topomyia yanbarensis]